MTKTYRPLGTKVLLRVIPIDSQSVVLLPDGQKNPNQHQYFEVVAIGPLVNEGNNKILAGETVMIAAHGSQMIGIDKEAQLLLVDREVIVAVVEDAQAQN